MGEYKAWEHMGISEEEFLRRREKNLKSWREWAEKPCPDCEGHGWTPNGHICLPCDGTGRDYLRFVRSWTDPTEPESIETKSRRDVQMEKKWEREKRRKELENLPELKAAVLSVERMFQKESEETYQPDRRLMGEAKLIRREEEGTTDPRADQDSLARD